MPRGGGSGIRRLHSESAVRVPGNAHGCASGLAGWAKTANCVSEPKSVTHYSLALAPDIRTRARSRPRPSLAPRGEDRMGVSETIIAAMIGAMATVTTALFQLFGAIRGRSKVDTSKPKRGMTLRSVLAMFALMVA